MKETIAFPQLVGLVAEKANTTERMSELFLQELFAVVTQELTESKSVTIKGLGTFKTTKDDSGKDVVFTPDKDLAEAVNAPFAQFVPVVLCDEVTDEMLSEIDNSMEAPKEDELQEAKSPEGDNIQSQEEQPQDTVIEQPQEQSTEEVQTAQETVAPISSSQLQDEEPQDSESRNYRKWLIAAAAAVALIAVWYFFTHRSKDRSDKATETTQVAKNDATTNETKPQPVVTDTIGGGNVLFTMAKKHYGDQAFWVYIARENQAQYPDYRKIKSGAILVIPPAEKYGINSDSKQSLKQANAEATKLYKEVKAADVNNVSTNDESKDEEKAKPQTTKSVKNPVKRHSSKYTHYKKHQKRRYHR